MHNEVTKQKPIRPIIRKLFPEFSDDELVLAQERIGGFLMRAYLLYLEDLRVKRKKEAALQKPGL